MTVELNAFDVSQQPPNKDDICEVDIIKRRMTITRMGNMSGT